ncbi:MAG: tRNA (guanosine(37)-N1)-methyltransferase TrmD [Saprospiraceae bacterium]|nr:tRNA (guanosine(37)-N1)-methyltransferase TrmD [Saprospiraceae bacterium]
MHFSIISVVPELLESPLGHSMIRRARDRGLLEIECVDLRTFGLGAYRQVDDYPYGGGAGMVLMAEPLVNCIENLKRQRTYDEIIYLTPDGKRFDQPMANRLSLNLNLMLICGHYKGIDQRVRDHWVSLEVSMGDYVLSGGEIAACALVDAVGRLIPGVLNDETSALSDSFQDGLLAPPVYTRPAEFRGFPVPGILLSGHQARIDEWRHEQALQRTAERRPDILGD